MRIGGFKRFSLIDYAGYSSAVVFTKGCNFRCPYCHNPELIGSAAGTPPIPETEIFEFLETRRGKLDGVVITGGEPTLQPDILCFMRRVREMGFLVKLDTNGSNPRLVQEVIEEKLADFIAMDVKGPIENYCEVIRADIDTDTIARSIELIRSSGMEYEFRTTVVRSQLSEKDIMAIAKWIGGARSFVLQRFEAGKTLDPVFGNMKTYPPNTFLQLQAGAGHFVDRCFIR